MDQYKETANEVVKFGESLAKSLSNSCLTYFLIGIQIILALILYILWV